MLTSIPILFLLIGVSIAADWEYTLIAQATNGQPCLSDCKNNKCIVDWDEHLRDCTTSNNPAPKYRTAQLRDRNNLYCLSNCVYYGHTYQWCVTTSQKGWDHCNSDNKAVTIYKKPCTSACHKGTTDYYWCFVDNGTDWQFCAPAREENTD